MNNITIKSNNADPAYYYSKNFEPVMYSRVLQKRYWLQLALITNLKDLRKIPREQLHKSIKELIKVFGLNLKVIKYYTKADTIHLSSETFLKEVKRVIPKISDENLLNSRATIVKAMDELQLALINDTFVQKQITNLFLEFQVALILRDTLTLRTLKTRVNTTMDKENAKSRLFTLKSLLINTDFIAIENILKESVKFVKEVIEVDIFNNSLLKLEPRYDRLYKNINELIADIEISELLSS